MTRTQKRLTFALPSFSAMLLAAGPVQAGSEPIIAVVPEWVAPVPDAARKPNFDPNSAFQLLDRQIRITPVGTQTYVAFATHVGSAATLASFANLGFLWDPEKGDLFVHKIEIVRSGKTVDVLATKPKFTVLRREAGLEKLQINGLLTATLQLQDVQVGDDIRYAYSVTQKDQALGNDQDGGQFVVLGKIDPESQRLRLVWPDSVPVRWQISGATLRPQRRKVGGVNEVLLLGPLGKMPEVPGDAPPRLRFPPMLEYSTFGDWQSVSRLGAKLFATDGVIKSDPALLSLRDEIAASSSDPLQRTAKALAAVQDRVRYLFEGMAFGSYRPAAPSETWTRKYGDCKAKSLLLLALLRDLGIEAQPVLVNASFPGVPPAMLPSMHAFDHVVVRARIGNDWIWLDGTRTGDKIGDLRDVPAFESGLPLLADGSALEVIKATPPARAIEESLVTLDASAGFSLPALFSAKVVIRGNSARLLQASQGLVDPLVFENLMIAEISKSEPNVRISSIAMSFDDSASTATITAKGIEDLSWVQKEGRKRLTDESILSDFFINADRNAADSAAYPVATAFPGHSLSRTIITLPLGGAGFSLQNATPLSITLAGHQITSQAMLAGGGVVLVQSDKVVATEISAESLPAERAKLSKARASLIQIVAPETLPTAKEEIAAAKKSGMLATIEKAYEALTPSDGKDTAPFLARADFYDLIGNTDRAINQMDKVLARDQSADNLLKRGNIRQESDPKGALADAQAALGLEPTSNAAIALRATVRIKAKTFEIGLAELDSAIENGADKADTLALRAEMLDKAGRLDEALAAIDKAIEQGPGKPDLLNQRCWIKGTRNRQLETALKDCTKAIALSDWTAGALDSRAMVYFRLGQFADALEDYDAALKLDVKLAPSLFMRGVVKLRRGDKPGGEADLRRARALSDSVDVDYKEFGILP
jgi:tetratricopeptide (TPR) repeat protein